ncbi:MAG: alpha-glucan family phosphorylase [Planctomycetes bacterium]|nr:alpha-glucan family phosphorylase [Planctomycetota bacterium]
MNVHIPTRPPDHLDVPASLGRLVDLSYNLWWTWNRPARQLFERIDADLWTRYRNPVRLLLHSRTRHLLQLADDASFMSQLGDVVAEFDEHLARPPIDDGAPVAYVSAEYGLAESLPIYSGGLGVLSADHLKEASDMAMPMVGIGLFYRRGYFRQMLDADGRQQVHYAELDALRLPLLRVRDPEGHTLRVPIELPGRTVFLRVWVTFVGRVPLLLLDSYTSRNAPEDRYITSQLYVSGREMRLEQEVVFGRGAVAVLDALGIRPRVFHMNEGHSAFLALENARRGGQGDLASALEAVRPRHVFTTHTPVPAGNEVFAEHAVRPFLEDTARDLHASVDDLLALGRADENSGFEPGFNLTALALRLSRKANGVSALHAEVSREMWPGFDIDAVTNGVHAASWLGREMALVLGQHEGCDPHQLAAGAARLSDETLWAAHTAQKHRLMRFVRVRALRQAARHGHSTAEMRRIHGLLNPNALTLGFARRFAPYKRADMLFQDAARLERLLCNDERPVQIIMAGKAHPADKAGQEIIERVWRLANSERLAGRVVFVEDYDTAVARLMVRGVDVWLNTPEYPREASGTSGMKAAMNGVLHASVPDGWWAEADRDMVGFTIGEAVLPDRERDSHLLYALLEERIVPLFFERVDGLPRGWIAIMRRSIERCLGHFSTRRMLTDYAERLYDMAPARVG